MEEPLAIPARAYLCLAHERISDPAAAARRAARNPWFERAARLGYAANGILHATVGVLAAVIATGGKAEADQSGAMLTLAAQPFGVVLLWICASGAVLLGAGR